MKNVNMSKKQVRNQATKVSSELQSNYSELSLALGTTKLSRAMACKRQRFESTQIAPYSNFQSGPRLADADALVALFPSQSVHAISAKLISKAESRVESSSTDLRVND